MKKVIVINDKKDLLEILSIILTEQVYRMICSKTPDTPDQATEIKPSLILLDIQLEETKKMNVNYFFKK